MRLVASAKSWLSYGGAKSTAPILPWGAAAEVPHLSPVEASREYLRHLAAAFDADAGTAHPGQRLPSRMCSSPVPASFDEEARELTLRAAGWPASSTSRSLRSRRRRFMPGSRHGGQVAAPGRRR